MTPLKPSPHVPRQDPAGYPEVHPHPGGRHGAGTLVFLHGGNVGNWMWDPQVRSFADHQVLTPHLPGFGARVDEDWEGLDSAADDVAAFIADESANGTVHLVGLSLGAVVGLRVLARHPELVQSALVSGAVVAGVGAAVRAAAALQLRLWDSEWFWRLQAGAFGIPEDSRRLYTDHGLSTRADNMGAMLKEVYAGGLPAGLSGYAGPLLAVAGQREPKLVARGFPALRRELPQAQFRLAPGMHHAWSIENPLLFNSMVRTWAVHGAVHPRLLPAP